jgi:hypothetical protein
MSRALVTLSGREAKAWAATTLASTSIPAEDAHLLSQQQRKQQKSL